MLIFYPPLIPSTSSHTRQCATNALHRRGAVDWERIGCAPEEVFFPEGEPFESRLLHQFAPCAFASERAPVVIKLVRPETVAQLLCDLELLNWIEGLRAVLSSKNAIVDFGAALRQQMDLTGQQRWRQFGATWEDLEMLRVPEVIRDSCGTSILTIEAGRTNRRNL